MDNAMDILLTKLDDAIHDMERWQSAGRGKDAWKEIDVIESPDRERKTVRAFSLVK